MEDTLANLLTSKGPCSTRTLAKHVGMSNKNVSYVLTHSDRFVRVNPLEVGSGKYSVNVWKNVENFSD